MADISGRHRLSAAPGGPLVKFLDGRRRLAQGFAPTGFREGVKTLGANDGDSRARVGEADR